MYHLFNFNKLKLFIITLYHFTNNQKAHRVTIGTMMKVIRQAITTPIIIFNLQFLQYINLYS